MGAGVCATQQSRPNPLLDMDDCVGQVSGSLLPACCNRRMVAIGHSDSHTSTRSGGGDGAGDTTVLADEVLPFWPGCDFVPYCQLGRADSGFALDLRIDDGCIFLGLEVAADSGNRAPRYSTADHRKRTCVVFTLAAGTGRVRHCAAGAAHAGRHSGPIDGGSQMEAILAHEMCHVRRRDNLTFALHMLVEVLFSFHPLVWRIRGRLVRNGSLPVMKRCCNRATALRPMPREFSMCASFTWNRLWLAFPA